MFSCTIDLNHMFQMRFTRRHRLFHIAFVVVIFCNVKAKANREGKEQVMAAFRNFVYVFFFLGIIVVYIKNEKGRTWRFSGVKAAFVHCAVLLKAARDSLLRLIEQHDFSCVRSRCMFIIFFI